MAVDVVNSKVAHSIGDKEREELERRKGPSSQSLNHVELLDKNEDLGLNRGLKINFTKNKLYGVGVSEVEGDKNGRGEPDMGVEAMMRRSTWWKPVVEKLKAKLSSWKAKIISFGGHGLLGKWLWRFLSKKEAMWVKIRFRSVKLGSRGGDEGGNQGGEKWRNRGSKKEAPKVGASKEKWRHVGVGV
ncbi:hypothetical protein OSB04_003640 [Centaurea solstitialis]|uniref:Uncharacterized protein n=1 Tax=Centaurea solstitialis TaxID=347529 RepID=A0AA38TVI7_9ASTR|nr:hypothetical protein OSB04_003640 [Centaurea solstitialis]